MKHIGKIGLVSALLLGSISANAGKIYTYITPASPDNEITLPNEAREVFSNKNVEYNLDPSVPSPFGNYTGARIVYKPEGTLNYLDYLVISLDNAYFSDKIKKCWLVFYEHNGLDTDGNGVGDASYDLTNDGDTNDSVVIAEAIRIEKGNALFRVTDYKPPRYRNFHPQSILYLACAEKGEPPIIDENRDYAGPPAEYNDMYNLVIKFKKPSGTPIIIRDKDKNSICIEVPDASTCCPSTPLIQLTTKEKKCFINFKNQFSIDMTPAVSYINTYPDLDNADCDNSKSGLIKCYLKGTEASHRFVPSGSSGILSSDNCTEEHASGGWITINNNPDNDIDDPVHLSPTGWKGKISIEMYDMNGKYRCDNSPQGYKGLDLNRMFIDNNGERDSNATGDPVDARGTNDIPISSGKNCSAEAYVYESGTPSSDAIIAPLSRGWEDDIYIGVKSDEYLKMIRWGLKFTLSILDNDNNEVYKYTLTESDEPVLRKVDKLSCCYDNDFAGYFLLWKPNGDEAYVPYMLNSNQFRVIVSNNSCWDAEIYGRVWDSRGRVVDNVYLGKIGKNSVKILTGDYIFAKARQFNPLIGKNASPLYSVILTVGAPKRDIEFAAYDNRNEKSKMIPIYDLDSHEWTYRNVDFDTDAYNQ